MKMTQAWGWLAAGVLAAGLNASYHDGGLERIHEFADRAEHNSAAVLALASGHVDQFLTEASSLAARNEKASCRFATAMARVQAKIARSESGFERVDVMAARDVMSAREEAQLARLDANRSRIEARIERQMAHLRIPAVAFAPEALKAMPAPDICPRVRVNIPRVPMMKMPVAPVVHVDMASAGPV